MVEFNSQTIEQLEENNDEDVRRFATVARKHLQSEALNALVRGASGWSSKPIGCVYNRIRAKMVNSSNANLAIFYHALEPLDEIYRRKNEIVPEMKSAWIRRVTLKYGMFITDIFIAVVIGIIPSVLSLCKHDKGSSYMNLSGGIIVFIISWIKLLYGKPSGDF
jgi:hypothetical protein